MKILVLCDSVPRLRRLMEDDGGEILHTTMTTLNEGVTRVYRVKEPDWGQRLRGQTFDMMVAFCPVTDEDQEYFRAYLQRR